MIETVFALILTLNGNMIEHVYKNNLSDCLKSKRIAQNEVNPERVVFSCQKVNGVISYIPHLTKQSLQSEVDKYFDGEA